MNDTQLGRYRISRVLGQGSMGIVYEARDPHLDRSVAIKTARVRDLPADQAAAFERRFLTEARSAARLRHPSIVSVFDAGQEGAVTYLVMEFVDGVNLKQCLNNGVRFTSEGAVRLVLSVLSGLEHAHEQRVIHRDVKPENVLLDGSGLAKLTDFGIAKVLETDMDNGTQLAGLSIGTPRYMSPEQVKGLVVDARTDLYSAGVMLFELLTATTPFDGAHHMAVATQILNDPAPLASSRAPSVPAELDALVAKALAKLPEDRFQTADEFRNVLLALLSSGSFVPATTEAASGEAALALVAPDTAPILRWLFSQARASHAASDAAPSVSVLPKPSVGTRADFDATNPTLPVPTSVPINPALDGTRVAQREGFAQTVPPAAQTPLKVLAGGFGTAADGLRLPIASPVLGVPQSAQVLEPVSLPKAGNKKLWFLIGGFALVAAVFLINRMWAPALVALPIEEIIEDTRVKTPVVEIAPTATVPPVEAAGQPVADAPPVAGGPGAVVATPTPEEAAAARARREARAKAKAAADAEAAAAAVQASSRQPPSDSAQTAPVEAAPAAPKSDVQALPQKPAPILTEPCIGLSFLEKESCLWKQCATDVYRRHPACKRFNP